MKTAVTLYGKHYNFIVIPISCCSSSIIIIDLNVSVTNNLTLGIKSGGSRIICVHAFQKSIMIIYRNPGTRPRRKYIKGLRIKISLLVMKNAKSHRCNIIYCTNDIITIYYTARIILAVADAYSSWAVRGEGGWLVG